MKLLGKANKITWIIAFLVFAIALLHKTLIHKHFFVVDGDKIVQASAAINISEGHGYTIEYVYPQNLSIPVSERVIGWPPLYSYLLALVLSVTKMSIEKACFSIETFFVAAYLLLLLLITRKLQFPFWLQLLLLLYKGAEINDYIYYSNPTDLPGLVFIMACIYLYTLVNQRHVSTKLLLLLLVASLFAAYTRYLYAIVPFAVSFLLIWKPYRNKDVGGLKKGFAFLAVATLGVAAMLWANYFHSQHFFYQQGNAKGFYPENLAMAAPFFWATFFNLNWISTQLSINTSLSYTTVIDILRITGVILFGILVLHIILIRREIDSRVFKNFLVVSTTISTLVAAVLTIFSLTNSRFFSPPHYGEWTYIQEPRYFLPLQFLILISVCWVLFVHYRNRKSLIIRVFRWILVLVASVEILHGAWFVARVTGRPKTDFAYFKPWLNLQDIITNYQERSKAEGYDLVIAGGRYEFIGYGSLNDIGVVKDVDLLLDTTINASRKKTLVVVILTPERARFYHKKLLASNFHSDSQIGDFHIYTKLVNGP